MVARELKVFAFFANVLMMLVGGALIVVGVFAILDNHSMIRLGRINSDGLYSNSSTPGLLDVASVMSIVSGSLTILMAVQGMVTLCGQWSCMIAMYMAGLIILLLLNAATVGVSVSFTARVEDHLYNATYLGIKDQFEGRIFTSNQFSRAFDKAQVEFDCCGLDNYTDFLSFSDSWLDKESLQVPKTCCILDKDSFFNNNQYVFGDISCARIPTPQVAHIEKSCYSDIKDWLEQVAYLIMGMAIVGAGAELIGIMVTICIIREVSSSKEPK